MKLQNKENPLAQNNDEGLQHTEIGGKSIYDALGWNDDDYDELA